MNHIAGKEAAERAELFRETAHRLGLSEAVVEKDFWVCWTLKQIFSINSLRERLLFKGGTSLSKVFGVIHRFSEDIDLAVDYAALGFVGEGDPQRPGLSKTQQAKLLDQMLEVCVEYIRAEFLPTLQRRFRDILGEDGWSLFIEERDPHVVLFQYPRSVGGLSYLRPQILLELGTHAEFVPRGTFAIHSLAASEFPQVFDEPEVSVTALLAKRTFWEKVTILHAEFHRDAQKPLPIRYSRHYYDVALLGQSAVKAEALADRNLLAQVVRHKTTFYPAAWARYDLAVPGTLRVVPSLERQAELKRDYRQMAVMIFGEPPPFDLLLQQLSDLEREINEARLELR